MKRIKMIINDNSVIKIYKFLIFLEMIEKIKKNVFKVIIIKVILKDELNDIYINN